MWSTVASLHQEHNYSLELKKIFLIHLHSFKYVYTHLVTCFHLSTFVYTHLLICLYLSKIV